MKFCSHFSVTLEKDICLKRGLKGTRYLREYLKNCLNCKFVLKLLNNLCNFEMKIYTGSCFKDTPEKIDKVAIFSSETAPLAGP